MLVDSATHIICHTFQAYSRAVLCCAFSPDGTLLATSSGDETVKLWQVAIGSEVRTLSQHAGWGISVVFTVDGKHIISASEDRTARVYDVCYSGMHSHCYSGMHSHCLVRASMLRCLHRARCWRLDAVRAWWRCLMLRRATHRYRRSQRMMVPVDP